MTTSTAPVRRIIVAVTIGSFSVAALLGVVALLGGGDFGDTQVQILLTTLLVGVMSIGVLCFLITAGSPFQVVGAVGGVAALVPFVAGLLLIWGDGNGAADAVVKTFGVGAIVAGTLAQVCLLLVLAADKGRLVRTLLALTVVAAGVLAVIFSALVLGVPADSEALARAIGVIAILDALGTVVVAALAKFGPEQDDQGVGDDHRVTLPATLAGALDVRASETGRTRDELAVEAVERYLATPV